jgi:hypothetical protein
MDEGGNRVDEQMKIVSSVLSAEREILEILMLRPHPRSQDRQPACSKERSNVLAPFHTICTPMQTSRKEVSFTMTFVPV